MRASFTCLSLAALLLIAAPQALFAGGGPENAVVVINADVPLSATMAAEYARLRQIPPSHLIRLSGIPDLPKITIQQFRDLILKPLLQAIADRGLRRQTDYVIYSEGFPWAVDMSADMAGKRFPRVITNPASLTGLTYLYDMVLAQDVNYLAMDSNWYCRPLKRQNPPPVLSDTERDQQAKMEALLTQYQKARKAAADAKTPLTPESTACLDEAVTMLQTLVASHKSPELLYDLACVLALQGKPDDAMAALQSAYDTGWWNASLAAADSDLASLRERADFKALLDKMRQVIVESEPPRPFHGETLWSRTSEPVVAAEGRRYLLAAMLPYVGSAANTEAEALDCLRRSAAADGTCPTGTVYFMESTDWARTGPRVWAFKSAVEALGKLGVKAEALQGVLPKDKPDVAGAVIGAASFKWQDSGSKIVPGAFCDHLTSFGGVMTGAGQTVLSEFLRAGAAGACGTVTEPYNTPVKFPTAFLHVYYASGCSLAEAFYQSVRAPYQQLLVGDPLCQPWAKPARVTLKGLVSGDVVSASRWLEPSATPGATRFELYVDGVLRHTCRSGAKLRLDLTGLPSGQHEARVVAVCGPLDTSSRLILAFSTR